MTENITSLSTVKVWVQACTQFEQCEIESLDLDVSFMESPSQPTTQKENKNMTFIENVPRSFYGNGIDKLWVFIDNSAILRKRPITIPKTISLNSDYADKEGMNTIVGETIVGERVDFINVMFQYNISTVDTLSTLTGTGNLGHLNAVASVNTGVGVGRAKLRSREAVRYITGHEINAEMTIDFANSEVGVTQKAGIGDEDDGMAAFGYDGLDFGIWLRTIDTGLIHIPQTEWNKDKLDGTGKSGFILDATSENIFKFTYGWYGILPINFSIYGGREFGWIEVHVFDIVNKSQNPHLGNPTLPIFAEVERLSGTGEDIKLRTSSWRGGIVGKRPPGTLADRPFIDIVREKTIPGGNIITPILTIRNKVNFQGRENHVKARYATVALSAAGTKDVFITIYVDGILTGAIFNDYDPNNSTCEVDIAATAIVPIDINRPLGGTILARTDKVRINLFEGDVIIPIYPGQDVTICADSFNSTEISLMLRHIEEF